MWIVVVNHNLNLHERRGVAVGRRGGRGRAAAEAARRRAALHALHLQPQPLVLVVGAHGQQLVDGGVDGALVGAQHRFDHVVVHVREHRLEIRHRLGELQLHRGRHRAGRGPGRHERAGRAAAGRRSTAAVPGVAGRAPAILAARCPTLPTSLVS